VRHRAGAAGGLGATLGLNIRRHVRQHCRSPNVRGKTGTMEPGISGPAGYVEWTAPLPLRRYVVCSWTGGLRSGGAGSPEPVLPDGCMDIIWDGERLFVAGPDTVPNPTAAEGPFVVGVRFRPGMGPRFLGVPADELRDLVLAYARGEVPDYQMAAFCMAARGAFTPVQISNCRAPWATSISRPGMAIKPRLRA